MSLGEIKRLYVRIGMNLTVTRRNFGDITAFANEDRAAEAARSRAFT
jgi:hypothetical protein